MSNSQLDMLISPNNSDFSSIEDLYKSRTNMMDVTLANKLHIDFEQLSKNRSSIIKKIESIKDVNFFEIGIRFLDETFIIENDGEQIAEVQYGQLFTNEDFKISLLKPTAYENKVYKLSYINPSRMAKITSLNFHFTSNALTNRFYGLGNGDIMTISFHSPYIEEGKKVLDYANELFLNRTVASSLRKRGRQFNSLTKELIPLSKRLIKIKII